MNRSAKSLLGVLLPPVLVFLLFFLVIQIDIYSSILLTVVTLFIALLYNRRRRAEHPRLTSASEAIEGELAALMKKADEDMGRILQVAKKVKSKEVSQNAMELYQLGDKIMVYLRRNPHKITKARRFFNYYMETARDILTKYHEFEMTGIKAQAVEDIEVKTTGALVTLKDAFRKEYVRLATNEMLDIEADIDLLEKTNRSEK